jgi:hypothetical protein
MSGWYSNRRWIHRRDLQLQAEPLCAHCLLIGKIEPATIVDHVEPHRGNWTAFHTGKLQSLCRLHHDIKRAEEFRGFSTACDSEGYPLDPKHPWHTGRV